MFIARREELDRLQDFLFSGANGALVFGKRRVGKSTLVLEAAKHFDGVVVYKEMTLDNIQANMKGLSQRLSVSLEVSIPNFESLFDIVVFAEQFNKKMLFIIDEYQNLREIGGGAIMDSKLQEVLDRKSSNIKFIITGSSTKIIESLLESNNPLYGRFSLVMKLSDMNYKDSSLFYDKLGYRQKAELYSVFGGSPYVLENIDANSSLEENIKKLFLSSEYSLLLNLVEITLFSEIRKIGYLNQILDSIGNGKRKYSEIAQSANLKENGALTRYLNILVDMEILSRTYPINKKNDAKKTFYTIKNPIVRFYYAFIYGHIDSLKLLGADAFYDSYIKDGLSTFISYRFEAIAKEYFSILARKGTLKGILEIGSYWYDDKISKQNGEFDVAIAFQDGYKIYESKFLRERMDETLANAEIAKIQAINELDLKGIGLISIEGFSFESNIIELISGKDLYA